MELVFVGITNPNEMVKLSIDRTNKKLVVTSSKTGYKSIETPWKKLFDPGRETVQDKITSKMDDNQFKQTISMGMFRAGYHPKC